jgi:hypothetical protein
MNQLLRMIMRTVMRDGLNKATSYDPNPSGQLTDLDQEKLKSSRSSARRVRQGASILRRITRL